MLLMVVAVDTLHGQDGLVDAFARLDSVRDFSSQFGRIAIATADFNHDTHPDGAVLFHCSRTFQIEVHFRYQPVSRITFASKFETLAISAFDVNNDGHPDLVVEEPFSHQRLFVWLNDGSGSFQAARAEDFPTASDDSYHGSAGQSRNPQSPVIMVPGKLRIRAPSSGSIRIASPANRVPATPPESLLLAQFISAPNLLRGPPFSLLL